MFFMSVTTAPSSERHLLSKAAPTLSLKMPCYGIFTFGSSRDSNLGTVAFESARSHLGIRKSDTIWYRFIFMVGEGGFEPPKSLTTDLQTALYFESKLPMFRS